MTQAIVTYLNAVIDTVGRVDERYCMAELRSDGTTTVPYTYVGNGKVKPISIDGGSLSYWRISGAVPPMEQIASQYGKPRLSATYPLRLVIIARRKDSTVDDGFMPTRLAEDIANALTGSHPDLKLLLKANTVSVSAGYDVNITSVWADEFKGTGVNDPNYTRTIMALSVSVTVIGDRACWDNECDYDPDILHLFDFCQAGTVARLTPEQVTCLEAALCEPCADATITVNTAPFGTALSGGALDISVKNTAGTLKGSKVGSDWEVPDATLQQNTIQRKLIPTGTNFNLVTKLDGVANNGVWDGVDTLDFTSAPCPPVANVSVAISTSTPAFDQVVTVTATATGITATSYTFYLPSYNGKMLPVTQASNVYLWTVKEVGNWDVRVTATDGSETGVGTIAGSTVGDVHASAFISRHNTVSGATMNATYQTYVLGWFLRAKGIYTTHAVDAFTPEIAAGGEAYLYIPVNSTTFSIPAFFINAFNPTESATPFGFVSANASVNGLVGGAGKYATFNRAPSHFGQNTFGLDSYVRNTGGNVFHIGSAVGADGFSSVCAGIGEVSSRQRHQGNDTANVGVLGADITGHIQLRRTVSTSRFSNTDNSPSQVLTTDAFTGLNVTSSAPSTLPFMAHACNGSTGANRHSTSTICFESATTPMSTCRNSVWAEASIWLQTQFGRNV